MPAATRRSAQFLSTFALIHRGTSAVLIVLLFAAALLAGSTPARADSAGAATAGQILRPVADVLRQWSGSPHTAAWEALDDTLLPPTRVPSTDFIYAGRTDRVTEVALADADLGGGTVSGSLWFYANAGAATHLRVEAISNGVVHGGQIVLPRTGFGWRSIPLPVLDQSQLNDLRLRFTALHGGDTNVRAAHVQLGDIIAPPAPPIAPAPPTWFQLAEQPAATDPCPDPAAANPGLPALVETRWDKVSKGTSIESIVRVSRNTGLVSAEPTRVSTGGRGHHVSILVVLHNRCGDVIGVTQPERIGVSGNSSRRVYWSRDLGVEITSRTTSMTIIQTRDSDDLMKSFRRLVNISCQMWDLAVKKLTNKDCPLG